MTGKHAMRIDHQLTLGVFVLAALAGLFGCASAPDQRPLPTFPWPPPRASATEVIPDHFLESKQPPTLLRDVDARIRTALERNGYFDSSYYAVPSGFALVTRLEQIEADGTSKSGAERWASKFQPVAIASLGDYLAALFRARPGFYRAIVFITTAHEFSQSSAEVTPDDIKEWLAGGFNRLPASIGKRNFSAGRYTCTALIYEFERRWDEDTAVMRSPGLPGRVHLVKSGLWNALQQ